MQRQHVDLVRASAGDLVADQRHALQPAAALLGASSPRVVDQNPPHHAGGDAEEVRAIAPLDLPLIDEAHVRFVDERRRLQRMTGASRRM